MSKRIIVNLSSPPDRTVIRDGKRFYGPVGDEVEEILNLADEPVQAFSRPSQTVDFALPHNQGYDRTTRIKGDKLDQIIAGIRTQTTRKDNFTRRALGRSGGRIGNPDVRPLRVVTFDNADFNKGRGQILEVTGVNTLGQKYPSLTEVDWNDPGLLDDLTPKQKDEALAYASAEGAVRADGTMVGRYTGDTLGDRRNYLVDGDMRRPTERYSPYFSDSLVVDFKPVGEPFSLIDAPQEIKDKIRLQQLASSENLVDDGGRKVHVSRQLIDGVVRDENGNEILYTAFNDQGLKNPNIGLYDAQGEFTRRGEYQGGVKYPSRKDSPTGVDFPTAPLKMVVPADAINHWNASNYMMEGTNRKIVPMRAGGVRHLLGLDPDNLPESQEFYELVRRYAGGEFDPQDLPDFILNSPMLSIPTDGTGKPFHGGWKPSMNYLAGALGQRVKQNRQLRLGKTNPESIKDFSESTLFPRNQMETLSATLANVDRLQQANLSSSRNPIDLLQGHANFYLQDEIDDPRLDYAPAVSYEAQEVLADNPNYGKTITIGNIPLVDNLFRQELGEARPNAGLGIRGFKTDNRGFFIDDFGNMETRVGDDGNIINTYIQKPLVKTNSLGFPLNPIDNVITSYPSANLWLDPGVQYPLSRAVTGINQKAQTDLDYAPLTLSDVAGLTGRMTPSEIHELNRSLGQVIDEPLEANLAPLTDPRRIGDRPLTDDEIRGRGEGRESDRVYRWSPSPEGDPTPYIPTLEEIGLGSEQVVAQLKGEGYNPENQALSIFDLPDNVYLLDSESGTPMKLSVAGTRSNSYQGAAVPGFLNQMRGVRQNPRTGEMTGSDKANIVGIIPPRQVPDDADEIVQGMGYESYSQYLNENRFLYPDLNKAKLAVDGNKNLFVPDWGYDYNDPLIQDASFVPFSQSIRDASGNPNLDYLFSPARYSTGQLPEKGVMYPVEDSYTILDDLLGRAYIEFNGKKYPLEPTLNYGAGREMGAAKADVMSDAPIGEGLTPTIEDAINQGQKKLAALRSELGLRKARSPVQIKTEAPDTPLREGAGSVSKPTAVVSPVSSPDGGTVYREHFPNTGAFDPNRGVFISGDRKMAETETGRAFSFYDEVIPASQLDDATLEGLVAHYENEIARATTARDKVYALQEVDPIDLTLRSVVTPAPSRDPSQSVARPLAELTPEEVEEIQRPGRERAVSTLSELLGEIKRTRTAPRSPLPAPVLASERQPLPAPITLDSILESEPVIDVPVVEVSEVPEVVSIPTLTPTPDYSRSPIYFPPVEERKEREEVLNSLLGESGQSIGVAPNIIQEAPNITQKAPNTLDELLNQPTISSPVATPISTPSLNTPSSPSSSPSLPIENPNGLVRLPNGQVVPRWMIALGLGGVALGGLAVGRELSRGDSQDDRTQRVRDWYGY